MENGWESDRRQIVRHLYLLLVLVRIVIFEKALFGINRFVWELSDDNVFRGHRDRRSFDVLRNRENRRSFRAAFLFLYQLLDVNSFLAVNVPFCWGIRCAHAIRAVNAFHVMFYLIKWFIGHFPRHTNEFREIVYEKTANENRCPQHWNHVIFTCYIFDGRTISTSCIQYAFNDIYLFETVHDLLNISYQRSEVKCHNSDGKLKIKLILMKWNARTKKKNVDDDSDTCITNHRWNKSNFARILQCGLHRGRWKVRPLCQLKSYSQGGPKRQREREGNICYSDVSQDCHFIFESWMNYKLMLKSVSMVKKRLW